jgi:hypothetical protein
MLLELFACKSGIDTSAAFSQARRLERVFQGWDAGGDPAIIA